MLKIVLLGTGNLAEHLFEAFTSSKTAQVVQVVGRNRERLSYFRDRVDTANTTDMQQDAEVYICAVSDDAIEKVSQYPKNQDAIVLHCSGAVPITVLPGGSKRGVFYPLQTFSKDRKVNFSRIPICVEAESQEVLEVLLSIGRSISDTCISITSEQRKSLHLAAVFANNFTNHLLYRASKICEENKLPFSLLLPLIEETVTKIDTLNPFDAQTGPARRDDKKTLEKHMELMTNTQDREIYRILSRAIQETYGNQL